MILDHVESHMKDLDKLEEELKEKEKKREEGGNTEDLEREVFESRIRFDAEKKRNDELTRLIYGIEEPEAASDAGSNSSSSSKGSKPVPAYKVGRLPTSECEIDVVVEEDLITFTWRIADGIELKPKDWIGLYIHDRQFNNKFEQYVFLQGKREGSGSFKVTCGGYYDLRYFRNNGSEERSRTRKFLVGREVRVEAALQGRRKLVARWDRAAETRGDWLALYPVGTYSNTQYLQKIPVTEATAAGEVKFEAPRKPGAYVVRYFTGESGHRATGYPYSGRSKHVVVPDEDSMEVVATHPVVRVRWQTYSQQPNKYQWIGLFNGHEAKARQLGWVYCCEKGLMDTVGDCGVAELKVSILQALDPAAQLPEDASNWEVRLYTSARAQHPHLTAPFLPPHHGSH